MQPAAEASSARTDEARGKQRVRNVLILLNEKAGSVGPKAGAQLVEVLKSAGVEQFVIVDATRMSRRSFQRAHQFDAIIVLGVGSTSAAISGMMMTAANSATCAKIDTGTVYQACDPTFIDGSTTSPNMSRGTAQSSLKH